jgi:ATP synthase protein I
VKANDDELMQNLDKQAKRRQRFEQRPSFWSQTIFTGSLGVVFVLPVVIGAYLGQWLDTRGKGFSFSWTIDLIMLGVIVGGINVYLFIRERR